MVLCKQGCKRCPYALTGRCAVLAAAKYGMKIQKKEEESEKK